MFLRKHYVALYCYVCLKNFKEGEMIISTAMSNRTKVRHLNCWLKMWQGNDDIDPKTFLQPQNLERHNEGWRKFPEIPRPACPRCLSLKIYRAGIRQLKNHTRRQQWECSSCGRQFSSMIQEEKEVRDGVTNLPRGDSLSASPKTDR
jgi:hypothetical protein